MVRLAAPSFVFFCSPLSHRNKEMSERSEHFLVSGLSWEAGGSEAAEGCLRGRLKGGRGSASRTRKHHWLTAHLHPASRQDSLPVGRKKRRGLSLQEARSVRQSFRFYKNNSFVTIQDIWRGVLVNTVLLRSCA